MNSMFTTWWELIYLASFLLGTGYLLILALMGNIGGDADVDLDADVDADFDLDGDLDADLDADADADQSHDGAQEFSIFTPIVFAALMTGIGATGLFAFLTLGLTIWFLHLPVAALGGWVLAYMIWWFFAKVIYPMQGSSEVRVSELWGTVGEVITPIPDNRVGEIRFIAAGSYVSSPARSATGKALPRGQTIIIEKIENSVAIVRPTK